MVVVVVVLFSLYPSIPSNTPYCRLGIKGTSSDKDDNEEQKLFALGGVP
jgi:hypothetical protein